MPTFSPSETLYALVLEEAFGPASALASDADAVLREVLGEVLGGDAESAETDSTRRDRSG